jgi:hypothetical protein
VRYLDDYLKLPQANQPGAKSSAPAEREDVTLMLRIAAGMHHNRWRYVYRDWLETEFGGEAERLRKLLAEEWLSRSPKSSLDAQGQPRTLEPNPTHATARAAYHLARWIPTRVEQCLGERGMQYVDSNFLAGGMRNDQTLSRLGVGQTRTAAENWLHAAAGAGLVVAEEINHPQNLSKTIVTWRLPGAEAAPAATVAQGVDDAQEAAQPAEATPPPAETAPPPECPAEEGEVVFFTSSGHLRQLLTDGLNDGELTRLLFDNFRSVHREVEGAPKGTRIQALLDYVERCRQHELLLAAVREINPALGGEAQPQLLAA